MDWGISSTRNSVVVEQNSLFRENPVSNDTHARTVTHAGAISTFSKYWFNRSVTQQNVMFVPVFQPRVVWFSTTHWTMPPLCRHQPQCHSCNCNYYIYCRTGYSLPHCLFIAILPIHCRFVQSLPLSPFMLTILVSILPYLSSSPSFFCPSSHNANIRPVFRGTLRITVVLRR